MKDSAIRQKILKIAPNIFESVPVLFAYLYGSVAVDQAHPFSDLDVAVYVPPLSVREKMELEMSLSLEIDEKLKDAPPSDVRVMNEFPLAIAGQVVTYGILIYCRDDNARIDYETSIRKAYFDFLPVIEHYQRSYREHLRM